MVWDWDVARDRVVTIPDVSIKLGLSQGAMHGAARNWLPRLHPTTATASAPRSTCCSNIAAGG